MLKKLLIQNFQAHKKLEIELDPKITTIVGPTDTGKSAIIRALRWCLLNKPTGESFRRHNTRRTIVRIQCDKPHIRLTRKRSDTENLYVLDGSTLQAFGAGVPEKINKILKVTENNFQQQHDASFWLSDSPGHVAKQLNKIVDLSIIDVSQSNIAKEVKKAKLAVEVSQDRLQSAREDLKTLRSVVEKDEKLRQLEALWANLADLQAKRASGSMLVKRVVELQTTIARQAGARLRRRFLLQMGFKLEKVVNERRWLDLKLSGIEITQKQLCEAQKKLKLVKQEIKQLIGNRCPICGQTIPTK